MNGRLVDVREQLAGSELLYEYPRIANEVTNPGGEVNTSGWAYAGTAGGALARDTAVKDAGAASLRADMVNGGASSDRIENTILGLVRGATYYARARVRATAGFNHRLWVVQNTGSVNLGQVTRIGDGAFADLLLTFVAADDNDHRLRFGRVATGSPFSVWADRVTLSRVNDGYVDGSTPGYAWEGTAENSRTLEVGYLYVADPTDFDPAGGELELVSDSGAEVVAYTAVDEATGRITLAAPAVGTYAEGDRVLLSPRTSELVAMVAPAELEEDMGDERGDDVLEVRVPHNLVPLLEEGLRASEQGDESVEYEQQGDELVLTDVLGLEPVVDGTFVDPETLPPGALLTDDLPPATSPPATVQGGIGFLRISWPAVANVDQVVYEVHLDDSSGFTPSAATLAGRVSGTSMVVRTMPDGTPLAYGTTYYARIVAMDADGSAAAGTEGSGQLVQVTGPDIAVNSIVAEHILAGEVQAEHFEAVLALASAMVAGTLGAQRVEIGYGTDGPDVDPSFIGIRAFAADGTTQTFRVDAITGEVYVRGRVDWGTLSKLLDSDVLEVAQQTASSFMTPTRVQSTSKEIPFTGNAVAVWPNPTQAGNLLIAVVLTRGGPIGGPAPTPTAPAGWVQVLTHNLNHASSSIRLTIFKRENSVVRSGNESFSFSGGSEAGGSVQLFEYSGADIQDVNVTDVEASNSNALSASPSTGTPPTPTQANELWLAAIGVDINASGDQTPSSPTNGYTQSRSTRDGSFLTRLTSYERAVSAIASPAMAATLSPAAPWVAAVVAFKAKVAPANVGAGPADTVRQWARDVGGKAYMHHTREDGVAGAVVLGTAGEVWRMEYQAISVNPPSLNAHAGGSITVTVPGLAVGDLCFFVGDDSGNNAIQKRTRPLCTVAGQINVGLFNADSAAQDATADLYHFLILHRS